MQAPPASLAGSEGQLAGRLTVPEHLFSLLHEEVYFNEAAFGLLAFYLSKRWPCAAPRRGGDL